MCLNLIDSNLGICHVHISYDYNSSRQNNDFGEMDINDPLSLGGETEIDDNPFGSRRMDIDANEVGYLGEAICSNGSPLNYEHDYASDDLKKAKIEFEIQKKEFRNQVAVLKKV